MESSFDGRVNAATTQYAGSRAPRPLRGVSGYKRKHEEEGMQESRRSGGNAEMLYKNINSAITYVQTHAICELQQILADR